MPSNGSGVKHVDRQFSSSKDHPLLEVIYISSAIWTGAVYHIIATACDRPIEDRVADIFCVVHELLWIGRPNTKTNIIFYSLKLISFEYTEGTPNGPKSSKCSASRSRRWPTMRAALRASPWTRCARPRTRWPCRSKNSSATPRPSAPPSADPRHASSDSSNNYTGSPRPSSRPSCRCSTPCSPG